MSLRNWLDREVEEINTGFVPPPVARVEPPKPPEPDALRKGLEQAVHQERHIKELTVNLTEATLKLESARRQIGEQSATIATLQNNELNHQAQIEVLRQDAADLRAFCQQLRATIDFILTRFDEHGMPKMVKNNVTQGTQGKVLQGSPENQSKEAKATAETIKRILSDSPDAATNNTPTGGLA